MDKVESLVAVCGFLTQKESADAAVTLDRHYPFDPAPITRRAYGPKESTEVFVRDGFIDRYSGERLVFPPVLRLVSKALPDHFPYHPNWKTDVTHPAFWEIGATVDHLEPVSLGGEDGPSNWVTTSMALNSAKMNWTLDQLGWELHPPGRFSEWDGLLRWFIDCADEHPDWMEGSTLDQWYRAAERTIVEL